MAEVIEKSKRSFSKKLIVANIGLAWLALGLSVPFGQAAAVVAHVFAFITVLIGIYTGIGHMDYRKVLEVTQKAAAQMRGENRAPDSFRGDHDAG